MGNALLTGWLNNAVSIQQITVIEPNNDAVKNVPKSNKVSFVTEASEIIDNNKPKIIVFATKPQIMDIVTQQFMQFSAAENMFLSIVAGKTIKYFEKQCGKIPIVRAMPNTPASIRLGITVACANKYINKKQKDICDILLKAVGSVAWIEDENLLDPITAISGGGPAYVFLLTECLTSAGIQAGLPDRLAHRLARETISGAGAMLQNTNEDAETLRMRVTSPGGTTAEAIRVLTTNNVWQNLVTKAIKAAALRSQELAD